MSKIEDDIDKAVRSLQNDIIRMQHQLAESIVTSNWSQGTRKISREEMVESIHDSRQTIKALENHEKPGDR